MLRFTYYQHYKQILLILIIRYSLFILTKTSISHLLNSTRYHQIHFLILHSFSKMLQSLSPMFQSFSPMLQSSLPMLQSSFPMLQSSFPILFLLSPITRFHYATHSIQLLTNKQHSHNIAHIFTTSVNNKQN